MRLARSLRLDLASLCRCVGHFLRQITTQGVIHVRQAAPAFLAKTSYLALLASATQELSSAKIRQSIVDLVG